MQACGGKERGPACLHSEFRAISLQGQGEGWDDHKKDPGILGIRVTLSINPEGS